MSILECKLLSEREVADRLGVSLSTVRRLSLHDATFPARLKITADSVRYDSADLATWVKSRPSVAKTTRAQS